MQQINKQDITYSIMPANDEQRKYVFDNLFRDENYRENSIVFVATDETGRIIGRIVAKSKDDVLNSWYIRDIRVHTDYRRHGIGTALFRELQKAAISNGVKSLHGFAEATDAASHFWESLGFCLQKFGRVHLDGTKFGNYSHYMFRSPAGLTPPVRSVKTVNIVKATVAQLDYIRQEYLYQNNKPYFEGIANDIFGFAALNDDGDIIGFAVMRHESSYPPLSSMTLLCWVYVIPEMRRHGIGTALLNEVTSYACEVGISQVIHAGTDDELAFWEHIGFDVCIWGKITGDPSRLAIFAGKTVNKRRDSR